jgi:hypothetical protein
MGIFFPFMQKKKKREAPSQLPLYIERQPTKPKDPNKKEEEEKKIIIIELF